MTEYIVTNEQGENQQFHELIRCRNCRYLALLKKDLYCRHPAGLIVVQDDSFCSMAVRRKQNETD